MPTICCRAHLLDESAPETRERETLRPSSEVPPLPWTSPALLQPWPDAASDYQEVRDAHGKPVFIRNWREVASAIRYVVQLVNREHFAALAPPPPDDERLRADRLLLAVEAAIANIQHNRIGAAVAGLRVARDLSRAALSDEPGETHEEPR